MAAMPDWICLSVPIGLLPPIFLLLAEMPDTAHPLPRVPMPMPERASIAAPPR